MNKPLVGIIVLCWNHKDYTDRCLEAVFRQTYQEKFVLVVDNGSTDGTGALVKKKYPGCRVIENGKNLGYAEGNNVGIREALRLGADYVLILNNDLTLGADGLEKLVGETEKSPKIGIAGPALPRPEGPVNGSFRKKFYFKRAHSAFLKDYPSIHQTSPMSWIPGCCMLIRRSLLEKVGLLDSAFFAYHEDREFCFRARQAGFHFVCVPGIFLTHYNGLSTGGVMSDSPMKNYLIGRNKVLFYRKHMTGMLWWGFLCWVLFKCMSLFLGQWFRPNRKSAYAKIRGFYDGFIQPLEAWPVIPKWMVPSSPDNSGTAGISIGLKDKKEGKVY